MAADKAKIAAARDELTAKDMLYALCMDRGLIDRNTGGFTLRVQRTLEPPEQVTMTASEARALVAEAGAGAEDGPEGRSRRRGAVRGAQEQGEASDGPPDLIPPGSQPPPDEPSEPDEADSATEPGASARAARGR